MARPSVCKIIISVSLQAVHNAYAAFARSFFATIQLTGISSLIRLGGIPEIEPTTSRRYSKGSTPCRLQDSITLYKMAARSPPSWEPANSQFLRLW